MSTATSPAHTPTPWRIGQGANSNRHFTDIVGPIPPQPPKGVKLAELVASGVKIEDAALIVRAVNSHAELVAALDKIVADSLLMPANQSPQSIADFNASLVVTARSIARAALASAKGVQS